jgi:hypothetical protein
MACVRKCDSIARRKSGRYFQVPVRLEITGAARAYVVQHENCTDARKDRTQQDMRPREIERSQAGAYNGIAELLHSRKLAGRLG